MAKAKKSNRGVFIVIDGTDGSGKATQTELLVKKIRQSKRKVAYIDFPQYGERSAAMVEDYLNGKYGSADEVGPYRASLFFASDRFAASFKISKWLSEGQVVIANRYTSSNMGHQTGKIKGKAARDKFLNWLKELEFKIFAIPKPDLTILLYLDPEIGQQRVDKKGYRSYLKGTKRDIHEADLKHLNNAANAYLYVARKYHWPVVNANQGIKAVNSAIWKIVARIL
jgi:dTMP kinase